MPDISIFVADGEVHLDCSRIGLSDDAIADNLNVVTELLAQLLLVEQAKALLTDETLQQRLTGIAAQDMMLQASNLNALNQAKVLQDIIAGRASTTAYGFPEFRGETAIDV